MLRSMLPSPSSPTRHNINTSTLCGKLTTTDADTYIVVCLHCLHYFRSLADLLRHRLLNHNILDTLAPGDTLPRTSKDGSWLVAGGDNEPPAVAQPPQPWQGFPNSGGLVPPSRSPVTPSPPPIPIHVPQFRSLGPHHQMQQQQPWAAFTNPSPQQARFNPPHNFPHGRGPPGGFAGGSSAQGGGGAAQARMMGGAGGGSTTTFSPAAREFVPSGMTFRGGQGNQMGFQPGEQGDFPR